MRPARTTVPTPVPCTSASRTAAPFQRGDPDHPVTRGFLCGKVSNYLDASMPTSAVLHPLVRERGRAAPGVMGRGSKVAATGRRRERSTSSAARRSCPTAMRALRAWSRAPMSQRVINALGASERFARSAPAGMGASRLRMDLARGHPEEWSHAAICVWGWNPMSTAPHLWRLLLKTRSRRRALVVVDPSGADRALADEHLQPLPGTDAALALGMMRTIRRQAHRRRLVPRPHERPRRAARAARGRRLDQRGAEVRGTRGGIDRIGLRFRPHPARGAARRRRPAPPGRAPAAYSDVARYPPSWARGDIGAAAARHPRPPIAAAAICAGVHQGLDLHQDPGRHQHVPARRRAISPTSTRREGTRRVELDPPQVAPDQTKVLAGLAQSLFTVVLEQFMTDTAAHADVVLPATTQLEHLDVIIVGPPLRDAQPSRDRAAGEAKPNLRDCRLLAARLHLGDGAFGECDEELVEQVLTTAAEPREARRPHQTRVGKGRPRPGRAAARRRRVRDVRREAPPAGGLRASGRGGADAELATRFPSALGSPPRPPLPELHVREPGAPGRGAKAVRGRPPRRCRGRAGVATRPRARVQRPRLVRRRRGIEARRASSGWRRWSGTSKGASARRRPPAGPLHEEWRSADVQRQPRRARAA